MKEDFKLNLEGTTLTVIMSYALASKNSCSAGALSADNS